MGHAAASAASSTACQLVDGSPTSSSISLRRLRSSVPAALACAAAYPSTDRLTSSSTWAIIASPSTDIWRSDSSRCSANPHTCRHATRAPIRYAACRLSRLRPDLNSQAPSLLWMSSCGSGSESGSAIVSTNFTNACRMPSTTLSLNWLYSGIDFSIASKMLTERGATPVRSNGASSRGTDLRGSSSPVILASVGEKRNAVVQPTGPNGSRQEQPCDGIACNQVPASSAIF